MGDDIDDEIARERRERVAFSLNTVSFDEEFYGGKSSQIKSGAYNLEINDDDDGPVFSSKKEDKMDPSKATVRKALNSYTAPKHLLESRPVADVKADEDDPFKEFKRKTIAEREDEYRARWRKRKLSPPRVTDPRKGASSNERSYREIMMEQNLDREKHELLIKMQKKKNEEEKEKQRDMKEKNGGTLWDVRDPEAGPRERSRGKWVITVVKQGETIGEPVPLNPSGVLKIGRDRASDITLDHPSCSKAHATVKFQPDDNGAIMPHISDHGSTNGTSLNGIALEASRPYLVRDTDIVKFGASTREYMFSFKEDR